MKLKAGLILYSAALVLPALAHAQPDPFPTPEDDTSFGWPLPFKNHYASGIMGGHSTYNWAYLAIDVVFYIIAALIVWKLISKFRKRGDF